MKDILQELRNKMLDYYQSTSDVVPQLEDERLGRFDLRLYARLALQLRKMKKKKK